MKRLMIVTQTVDIDDPVLGFMHTWIAEFAKKFESIEVICLKRGTHDLPKNVSIYSLGKEEGVSRIKYIFRFFKYVVSLRSAYTHVLVHMNQEYVLLGGWLWILLGKRVYLWRNHYAGSFLTNLASLFCTKIFCTSIFSYTARFKKTKVMPIGIDTRIFKMSEVAARSNSILILGRIAKAKRVEVLIEALGILKKQGVNFSADVYGDAQPQDAQYFDDLKRQADGAGLGSFVSFKPAVPNRETPVVYGTHEIFVNASKSGMYDKTIFEAMACGCLTVAASADYAKVADQRLVFDGGAEDLAAVLRRVLSLAAPEKEAVRATGKELIEENSLSALSIRLADEIH